MSTDERQIIFRASGGKYFGYHAGEPFTSGAGHELCCAMGQEIERLRMVLRKIEAEARKSGIEPGLRCYSIAQICNVELGDEG